MKVKLGEVPAKAQSEGPQMITGSGRSAALVVAAHEGKRMTKRRGNLAEFLAASPFQFIAYNPARLPSPAEWVDVKRIRVEDAFVSE